MYPPTLWCRIGVVVIPFMIAVTALAQPDAPSDDDADAPPTQVAAQVQVTDTTSDRSIADRLLGIYEATGRYAVADIRVDDGVVFLTGTAESEAARQWAADLALRTEGVVAVNNDLAVARQPIWSLQPAADEARELWCDIVTSAPLFVLGILGFAIVAVLGGRISRIATGWFAGRIESSLLRAVVEKLLFLLVMLVGMYFFLRVSGLTRLAVTVVGGTGLVGIILGFAFRDIAENFLASILLSVQRPFRLGDTIEVEGHLGIVQKVTMRGTLLMDFDGNHIQIANAVVYKSTIKNFTANPKARIAFAIGIGYDDDIERAQHVAVEALRAHEAILDDPRPQVLVEGLAASTVNLQVYFWIDGARHSILKLKSIAQRHVLTALVEAGISLPDEQREIIFPNGVPVSMAGENSAAASVNARQPRKSALHREPSGESEAEGGIETEADEIRRQASQARQPDEGSDILASSRDD